MINKKILKISFACILSLVTLASCNTNNYDDGEWYGVGIDVGAKQEIYNLMCKLVEAGKSIIMISSEMPELIGMSDRIVVMSNGENAGELSKGEYDQTHLLEMASSKL